MASCEKCWSDAYMRARTRPSKTQIEHYTDIIKERRSNPCSPEEQAGEDAEICARCGKKAVHQHVKRCINCGYEKQSYDNSNTI